MAPASMRKALVDVLARRILLTCNVINDPGRDPDERKWAAGGHSELWAVASVRGVQADVEAMIGNIQRAAAKEVTP